MTERFKMKIAIIGSGISGLSSALILSQMHDVTVFEADARLGGHAHTFFAKDKTGAKIPVDTGFLVYNQLTYPHFCAMLAYLLKHKMESNGLEQIFVRCLLRKRTYSS
jgi:predicted NAD/FAD-binding protein